MNTVHSGEILVVEDVPASMQLLSELLSTAGHRVRQAQDGEMALLSLKSRPPELIILDIDMPGMNGFEVCEAIKALPATSHIPIIFCSAFNAADYKVRGLSVGAVDFITKPYDFEEVLLRVRNHLELSRLRIGLEQQVEARTAKLAHVADSLRKEISSKQKIEEERKLASKAFEASYSGIVIADHEGKMVTVNPAFTRITGYSKNFVIEKSLDFIVSEKDDPMILDKIRSTLAQQGSWDGEIWCRCKNGNVIPILITVCSIRNQKGKISNYIATIADLSEAKDAQTLIDFLAHRDNLTGLANRLVAKKHFDTMLAGARSTAQKLIVMCMDLDRFKVINDSLGHAVGDIVLKQLAHRLNDLFGDELLISREGGDEFLIVTSCDNCQEKMATLAEMILTEVSKELDVDGHKLVVTTSIGAAVFPDHGTEFEQLLMNAENALYSSKKHGGNCVSLFTQQMDAEARLRMELENCLRQAAPNNEFELVYQPKVSLETGNIVGAEALVRWNSPVLGFVSPANFIPLAEETGLILDIDEWVLHSVCQQLRRWQDNQVPIDKVSVNLSALQFQRGDLTSLLHHVLSESGIAAKHIDLEITEGMLMGDVEHASNILEGLKNIGVSISLDDFGTGYSSLNYLQKLPIDTLKIDKSFVDNIHTKSRDADITQTIIALGKSLGLEVVAEGVEYQEQFELLKRSGCHQMQGYYFSRPLAADDFEKLCVYQGQSKIA